MLIRSLSILGLTFLMTACGQEKATGTGMQNGLPEIQYPEPQSAAVSILKAKCSSCHAPPRPDLHLAEVWPGVVYRMEQHMHLDGKIALDDTERPILLAYLQRNAAANAVTKETAR